MTIRLLTHLPGERHDFRSFKEYEMLSTSAFIKDLPIYGSQGRRL